MLSALKLRIANYNKTLSQLVFCPWNKYFSYNFHEDFLEHPQVFVYEVKIPYTEYFPYKFHYTFMEKIIHESSTESFHGCKKYGIL